MSSNLVMVGGVPGVGKSTLCEQLSGAIRELCHLTASAFLSDELEHDQISLAVTLREFADRRCQTAMVDGHFVVGGKRVPIEAFRILHPVGVIVVYGQLQSILGWRQQDKRRQRKLETESEVRLAQEAEIAWAQSVAQSERIPFALVESSAPHEFRLQVLQMLSI